MLESGAECNLIIVIAESDDKTQFQELTLINNWFEGLHVQYTSFLEIYKSSQVL